MAIDVPFLSAKEIECAATTLLVEFGGLRNGQA